MRLIVVHQILIASAIGLAAIFAARSLVLFFAHGAGAVHIGLAAAALAIGAALAAYLRKVREKWAKTRADAPS